MITDLRADLKQMGEELKNVKSNQVQHMNGKVAQEEASFSEKSVPFPSSGCETMETSDIKNMAMNHRVLDDKCCSTGKQTERLTAADLDNFDSNKSDLASIIMRSKKPELYRNGCTQRIRAFEGNVLDGKLTPSEYVNNSDSAIESEFITKGPENEVRNFSIKRGKIEVENLSQADRKSPVKVRTFRRRKTRFGKAKTLRRCQHGQLLKSGKPCSTSSLCKPSSLNKSEEGACASSSFEATSADLTEASDGLQESLKQDEFKIIYKGKRKRNSRSGNDADASSTCPSGQLAKPCQPSPVLSRCRTFAYLVNGGIKSVEDQSTMCENETKVKPLPRLDPGLTVIKRDSNSISGSLTVASNGEAINKSERIQEAEEKDVELVNEHILVVKQGTDVVDDSRFSGSASNVELGNPSPLNCDLDNTKVSQRLNDSPSNGENNRLLKYTFQRKRKKEATSSPDEIASPEKSSVKRTTAEEHTAPESQKSRLMDESSRDSRRLAQVARQVGSPSIPSCYCF